MDSEDAATPLGTDLPVGSNSQTAEESSQTANDYIASQLSLEAEAREVLPYQFDTCTKPLGALRQSIYACLTCTPPPASRHQQFIPAGVCYSCSISCHGEHNLVELFTKRNFECDCGTTRVSNSVTPCGLRLNTETGRKGGVVGEKERQGNTYNQNFQGTFCACGEEYDPEKEKGTMFQCLGLGTVEDGGCGEDWWHPECLMGTPRLRAETKPERRVGSQLESVKEEDKNADDRPAQDAAILEEQQSDHQLPLGFPPEDDFDHLICYKCVNAFPWIRQYAGSPGFLTATVASRSADGNNEVQLEDSSEAPKDNKRKAEDDAEQASDSKRVKADVSQAGDEVNSVSNNSTVPKHARLPTAPSGSHTTLFLKEDFRDHFCRCPSCFPNLAKHPQLLEEEDSYEPPLSESSIAADGTRSIASGGSLLERGEAALSSMDRVRAIEGVMAYNHVRDKVKQFLQPFAETGQPVGAEDIKNYFAKLRGDEMALREAALGADGEDGVQGDGRREQGGY